MTAARGRLPAGLVGTAFRPARSDDLAECGRVWREALNDYLVRLNQSEVPDEPGPLGRLHGHTQATDPERFIVATQPAPGGERIVAFGSAVVRGPIWFLSMLFVRPEAQGQGLGRAILERLLPGPDRGGSLATAIDSLQPIAMALYASYGLTARMPLLDLRGDVHRPEAFPPLPAGISVVPFESVAAGGSDGAGHRGLASAVDALDRDVLGTEHPEDHRFLRGEGRRGFLYRGPDGVTLGYGYAGEVGRVGPIAVSEESLLEPIVGHLIAAVPSRGARAVWTPGGATRLLPTLLAAGLRIDGFPLMLCWDRPFADFARYVPISPGLL
ncbi:MAG: GNAT family N-acetyltransferase [Chloroflexota bacterium]|nr:GNAT family N-acetyltransferase [Chloroflexota bacterium]